MQSLTSSAKAGSKVSRFGTEAPISGVPMD
jgi:hypothetical protein